MQLTWAEVWGSMIGRLHWHNEGGANLPLAEAYLCANLKLANLTGKVEAARRSSSEGSCA